MFRIETQGLESEILLSCLKNERIFCLLFASFRFSLQSETIGAPYTQVTRWGCNFGFLPTNLFLGWKERCRSTRTVPTYWLFYCAMFAQRGHSCWTFGPAGIFTAPTENGTCELGSFPRLSSAGKGIIACMPRIGLPGAHQPLLKKGEENCMCVK
jgi:hypothetical protein